MLIKKSNLIKTNLIVLILVSGITTQGQSQKNKINGVNVVSPMQMVDYDCIGPVKQVNANWVSLCPFAFLNPGDPKVYYNTIENYWGDRPENLKMLANQAQNKGLSILLKPHFWVQGNGWPGEYDLNEQDWKIWEDSYSEFVLQLAAFAESMNIEMYCIGVEFKNAANKRAEFWEGLVIDVKKVYHGKLLYAANWDNYQNIGFWDQLDYIGIDAYFPLVDADTPEKEMLISKWSQYEKDLDQFSKSINKQIIFTEYGYRSVDNPAWKQWEIEYLALDKKVNMQAQVNAYEALFESLWEEGWFAGGFLWKWYPDNQKAGGLNNSDYTPQQKPAENIIKQWYAKY